MLKGWVGPRQACCSSPAAKMGRDGFGEADMKESLDRLRQTAERMEASLANGPWLIGEQFTLADVSLVPTFVRMEHLGLSSVWDNLPQVQQWYARVQARPTFRTAFYEGSLPPLPPL